jgi:hypothetical protein
MPKKPPKIPLVPAPEGWEEFYGEGNIISLQIRIEEKWAEMFKNNARNGTGSNAEYLISLMQFAAANSKLYGEWWMQKKKTELFASMEAIGRTLEGLSQHAAYQEQLDKAKAARIKEKPPAKKKT